MNGGYFYRPDWSGYTRSVVKAGRYDRGVALRHAAATEGVTVHEVGLFTNPVDADNNHEEKKTMTDPRYMRPGLDFARGKAVEELGELAVESGKLLAALGKSLRWGWLSANPELPPDQQETNAAWVRREMIGVRREIADALEALDNLEREMNDSRFKM